MNPVKARNPYEPHAPVLIAYVTEPFGTPPQVRTGMVIATFANAMSTIHAREPEAIAGVTMMHFEEVVVADLHYDHIALGYLVCPEITPSVYPVLCRVLTTATPDEIEKVVMPCLQKIASGLHRMYGVTHFQKYVSLVVPAGQIGITLLETFAGFDTATQQAFHSAIISFMITRYGGEVSVTDLQTLLEQYETVSRYQHPLHLN